MMALEMMGPVNEVVVPTMLKKEKKRNSFPRGVTSDIFFPPNQLALNLDVEGREMNEGMGANHDLTVTVVRGDSNTPPELK